MSEPEQIIELADKASGLCGFLVIDDSTLGPAAGGIRTRRYQSNGAALADAKQLARAMTLKCSIAGLDAGGGKVVVIDADNLDRAKAFAALGTIVEELGGRFYTAGDLGTTAEDLAVMAGHTQYVRTDEADLSAAVARGHLRCVEACAAARGRDVVSLRVAVQGCGAIGTAVAQALAGAGAKLVLADVDALRATVLAEQLDAETTGPDAILTADVDIVAPCAIGGVITADVANALRAWAVCGAANNILASADVDRTLKARDILHVPDMIASAGAVVEGAGEGIMHLADRRPLIDALGATARDVLAETARTDRTATEIAEARAFARISASA